jgi:potassium efflux system protein
LADYANAKSQRRGRRSSHTFKNFLTETRSLGGTNTQFTFQSIIVFIAVIWLSSVAAKIISYLYDVAGRSGTDIDLY